MTETQAKSGAAGASTDAGDPRVDTPAATEKGSGSKSDATDAVESQRSSDSDKPKVIRTTSLTGVAPAKSSDTSADRGTSSAPTSAQPGRPTPAGYTPTPTSSAPFSPASKVEDNRSEEPTVKTPPPSVIPVVAGPGTAQKGSKAAPAKTPAKSTPPSRATPPGKATPAAGPGRGPAATGTASVKPGKVTGPVVARATVTGTTTVTGTGIRQTTGATSTVPRSGGASAAAVGAARVSEAVRSARATVTGAASRGPRRARLHLKRIDPWSVMKFSFAVSLVLFVVAIVATSVLYLALDAMNVFESVNKAFSEVTGQAGGADSAFKITAKGVIGTAVLLGAVNMVLFTALMTLGAFVYNVCADLVGGIELTLSEKE
jgi:hypothetical protein